MIGKVFGIIVVISVLCSVITGNMQLLSDAVIDAVSDAVGVCISMMGIMCLYSGVMRVFENAGVTQIVSKLLRPFLRFVYSKKALENDCLESISTCFAANFLGLGNAALPFGINAVKKLNYNNSCVANKDVIMFAVLNTVPFQLVPTTLIALRKNYNSQDPFDIIFPIWVCSVVTIFFAVILCKLFGLLFGDKYDT